MRRSGFGAFPAMADDLVVQMCDSGVLHKFTNSRWCREGAGHCGELFTLIRQYRSIAFIFTRVNDERGSLEGTLRSGKPPIEDESSYKSLKPSNQKPVHKNGGLLATIRV
jgi:hypothetical protein